VVGEALATLNERDQAGGLASSPAERRQDMEHLFELIQRCVHEGHCEPIIGPSQQMAADHFAAGIEIAEVQTAFTVLEDVLWRHLADAVSGDQRLDTLRLVNVILGAGRTRWPGPTCHWPVTPATAAGQLVPRGRAPHRA